MELAFVPFHGAFFGINEKGLALALGLKPCAGGAAPVIPASQAIRRALCRTTTARDAASLIEETPRGASGCVAVADKESCLVLEFTPDAVEIRSSEDTRPIIAAQHFLAPQMMCRDIPHDDTYPGDAQEGLRWTHIYESSERRFTAARDILHAKRPVTGRDLTDMLTDDTAGLAVDGPYYHTLLSAVLLPRRGSIFLSTREDAGAYTRYALND
jgi:hypothetical protein